MIYQRGSRCDVCFHAMYEVEFLFMTGRRNFYSKKEIDERNISAPLQKSYILVAASRSVWLF
jgi:hypothetical protein